MPALFQAAGTRGREREREGSDVSCGASVFTCNRDDQDAASSASSSSPLRVFFRKLSVYRNYNISYQLVVYNSCICRLLACLQQTTPHLSRVCSRSVTDCCRSRSSRKPAVNRCQMVCATAETDYSIISNPRVCVQCRANKPRENAIRAVPFFFLFFLHAK